jgi:hypothetical protein
MQMKNVATVHVVDAAVVSTKCSSVVWDVKADEINIVPISHHPLQPQNIVDGIFRVEWLPASSHCCAWFMSDYQPAVTTGYFIEIDGLQLGTLHQGESFKSFFKPGTHAFKLKHTGMTGFFRGLVGSADAVSATVFVEPGKTSDFEVRIVRARNSTSLTFREKKIA